MKYKDTGFRAFYRHFIAVPMKENLKVRSDGGCHPQADVSGKQRPCQ